MKLLLIVLLTLTAVAIPALRIYSPIMGTSPRWNDKQKYNVYNFLWIVSILFVLVLAPVPWLAGLCLLLPILVLCAFSVSAAIDYPRSRICDLLYAKTWGTSTTEALRILKVRRYVAIVVLGFIAIVWISLTVTQGSNNPNAAPNTPSTTTSSPAATPSASPSKAAPSASPTPSSSVDPHCGIDTTNVSTDGYDTTYTHKSIDVCSGGHWVSTPVTLGAAVHVQQWTQPGDGYEYDFLALNGQNVWTRSPLKS